VKRLSDLKYFFVTGIKVLFFLTWGFIITVYVLSRIYETFGIPFLGNVWVNWFGVSYLLYFLYVFIYGILTKKTNSLLKERLTSFIFWIVLIASIYVVFIPFFIGKNPF
jgi:hypothetical protein